MAKLDQRLAPDSCVCGSNKKYKECCGRFLDGSTLPATAEMLMRSRYTAYTLLREDYLLTTWHASTRPEKLGLVEEKNSQWLGLQVKRHEQQDETHALVEFVARYKTAGRAQRLHEVSRFIREGERWFYVDGDIE
jgi:SEC-C motif-containing protein